MKTIEQFKEESWLWVKNYLASKHSDQFAYLLGGPLTGELSLDEYLAYFSLAQVEQGFVAISSQLVQQFEKNARNSSDFARYLAYRYLNEKVVIPNQHLTLQEIGENVETNFFLGLLSILSKSKEEQIPVLKGFLLFLVQEYQLHYASLVAMELLHLGEGEAGKDFIEFAILHQNADGSFGVLNPLKPNPFETPIEHQEWLFTNTLYLALFLEHYTRR